jgi:hypothetical protein
MSQSTGRQLLLEKIERYGVTGAYDPQLTLRAAEAKTQEETRAATGSSTEKAADSAPKTKTELIALLQEVGRDQSMVQRTSLDLIRKLGSQEKQTLSGVLDEVRKLDLPQPVLEQRGIKEAEMHALLEPYSSDEEVMKAMAECDSKSGLGSMERVKTIKFKVLVDIHEFMALKLRKVVEEVQQLPEVDKGGLTPRLMEVAAEVVVGIQVEKRFKIKNEDIELAIEVNEERLANHDRFRKVQEELQELMEGMMNSIKPAEKHQEEREEFLGKLQRVAKIQRGTKQFMENARRDLEAGTATYQETYLKLVELTDQFPGNDVDLIELRMKYDMNYKGTNAEIDKAWNDNRLDFQSFMTSLMFSQGNPNGPLFPPPPVPPSTLTADALVEMQEEMLSALKRHIERILEVPERSEWKPDLALALIQGLASADFEGKTGTTAEDMTIASFACMRELQSNQRFIQASMEQQQILQSIPEILHKADGKCVVQ